MSNQSATADETRRLNYRIESQTIVVEEGKCDLETGEFNRVFWLLYANDDDTQPGVFRSSREAIDTATSALA